VAGLGPPAAPPRAGRLRRLVAPRLPAPDDRWAAAGFAAVLVGAFGVYWVMGGRYYWFHQDDWRFLVERQGGGLDGLLAPHNEHWSTVPILVYRALYRLVGMTTYRPYQTGTILLHLGTAVLLRAVVRRAGVRPWLATASVAGYVLLAGIAWQNIMWGFQIGFVGALLLGLAHLLLVDHDGGLDRRDAAGLACACVGLMCAGVAVTMVGVVGLATLLRRGWRVALVHVAPPAALYLGWLAGWGHEGLPDDRAGPSGIASFTSTGLTTSLRALTGGWALAAVLGAVGLGGLALAVVTRSGGERRRLIPPVALAVGAVAFFAVAGAGRYETFGATFARVPRYLHLGVALLVPALAVAADAIARRQRLLLPVLAVPFLLGAPENIRLLRPQNGFPVGNSALMLTLPEVPLAAMVPRDTVPVDTDEYRVVTIGWLLDRRADGRLPTLGYRSTRARDAATLALATSHRPLEPVPRCPVITDPVEVELRVGDSLWFTNGVNLQLRDRATGELGPKVFFSRGRPAERIDVRYGGPFTVVVTPLSRAPSTLCVRQVAPAPAPG